MPSIVIDVNDVESTVIMGLTNKQREGTSDIEWGWAYRNTYEALKRPAANQYTKSAGSHDGNQQKTIDIVAQKYGVSKNSIHRKMRLTYLLEPLQKMYEDKKLSQEIAVELSYVSEEQQRNIDSYINIEKGKMDIETAKRFRELDTEGKLTIDMMHQLTVENDVELKQKTVRQNKYKIDESLFPVKLKKGEREGYIEKALKYIRENRIEL